MYAVASTGIYCRPSCPSAPAPRNVRFFSTPDAAEARGLSRLRPDAEPQRERRPTRAGGCARREEYLDQHLDETVTARAAGRRAVGLSPYHLQRTFKRHDRYVAQGLRRGAADGADEVAARSRATPSRGATYDAGYSSPSRAYDQGRAPARHDARLPTGAAARGLRIRFTTVRSRHSARLLVAATDEGAAAGTLGDRRRALEGGAPSGVSRPRRSRRADDELRGWAGAVVGAPREATRPSGSPLDVRGTAFQMAGRGRQLAADSPRRDPVLRRDRARARPPDGRVPVAARLREQPLSRCVIPCHRRRTGRRRAGRLSLGHRAQARPRSKRETAEGAQASH